VKLYSTKGQVAEVDLKEAVFKGLPDDNGLFMPTFIPQLPASFFENIDKLSFEDIALEVCKCLIGDEIPADDLKTLVYDAVNFPAPTVHVKDNIYCLELFHGPSLAFKDFGARFMSRLMSYYLQKENRDINILVATSGDTGSAVAQGFLAMDGISVTILYPSGKVSMSQEMQLTTLGQNITALEVDGVFDDCQALVKEAFLDEDLRKAMNLSSANSINIARLIPQSFYYFNAYAQLKREGKLDGKKLVFCTPSGNFGNICGGLIAQKMGLPIEHFLATTNDNDIVPKYLATEKFEARPSVATISNAMDVGNPSNFPRLLALHDNDYKKVIANVSGAKYNDVQTREAMTQVFKETGYIMCPHTAVGYLGLRDYLKGKSDDLVGVFLSTADASKFADIVEEQIGQEVEIPQRLLDIINRKKESILMGKDFAGFKKYLLGRVK
jgi:threonine synthase